ncbi:MULTISPECIES: 30S ribosomal protein S9 [Pseudothermotoga]|jgi:small subunit ribosomal protein S9|uniref:Small ribosomal subunit protein uS9 n=1 Tax=Pseudothermotoga lettingae (strain ATCC BAA-301 / DSM 14385 / NBRC 107922 / TMO) TaxID=416591 RepID=RS9_PSELT|nr:RecName: Full=Small ribosomal subunit protein uS9; AltName: Full=30S ribosomal protein S9 [Pseudothermotoga lettingae TMO]ABV34529.1 ribosomal protein S9 [Pseudothermotoga lettingae TMO]HBJ81532.1 30S ribosomal protein S9 [Pseudothermotoga sp.]HBT25204.1 30S ribosomal protein S9 [Pseudothermotoga sp.]
MMDKAIFNGLGRRKTSVARVYIVSGNGKLTINDKIFASAEEYFKDRVRARHAFEPLVVTNNDGKLDVFVRVEGGGLSGQAGAVRLALARALIKMDTSFKPVLKSHGMLSRDPRMVERKKYGLRKARRAPQYSKR